MEKSKIGIFGGTFDPVHNGHLKTARAIMQIREYSKIIFIPCHISPHKTDIKSAPAHHRLNMLELALPEYPGFEYSDYEITKGDISYSLDTVRHLKKTYSDMELIIGYDNILSFNSWKEPDEIFKLVEVVVMKRRSDNVSRKHKYLEMATYVDTPRIDISSTEIRERLINGKSITDMVPQKVEKYIIENGLYTDR